MKQVSSTLQRKMQSANPEERAQAARHVIELQQGLSYASEDNAKVINKMIDDMGIDRTGQGPDVSHQLAERVKGAGGAPDIDTGALATQLRQTARAMDYGGRNPREDERRGQ
jgi:hypothetical protein